MNFLKLANYKLSYKKIAIVAPMALLIISSLTAQAQIATYSFTGSSGDETTLGPDSQPANATVSDMSRGSGLTVWTYADGFNAYTWGATSSIDLNDYYEFTVTPDAGYSLTLTSLVFDGRYVDPIVDDTYFWTLRSSIDNFATDIQAPTGVAATQAASPSIQVDNTVDLTGGTFDNLTSPVTFRLYVYDVTNPNNFEWGIDNVDINGTVNAPTSTIIETIDFETVNYTLNTATSSGGPPATSFFDVFAVADEGTTHAFLGGAPTGVQGSNYLGYRNGSTVGSNNIVNSAAIDVSAYENLNLVFSLANPDLGGDQYETSDIIRIEYQFDGGGYQFLTQWAGDGATYMNEDADDTGGGDGVAATLLGPLFKSFQRSIPKNGSLLDIRFTILTTNESVIIDNIAIVGTTDVTAPEVTSIVRQTPATASTTATSVTFRVTFDEPVANVGVADFALSGTASGTINSVTPNSATEYDVNITTVSGNGDNLNLDFAGGQDITDVAGNAFTGTINSEEEYTVDNTTPEVTSIVRQTPATASTAATSVTFRVTFDEDVTNVDLTDFVLSGTASGTLNSITPNSATEYDVNVTTVSGNGGNLNLDFAGGQNITDIIGNAFAGTINSEEEYTIDNTAPEVSSITRQSPATASTNATTVTFRVTFNEGVTNVDLTDFALSGTASGSLNAITPNSTSEYDIDVVSVSGEGSLNLDFAGGQNVTDNIGNAFAGTINSEEEYTIDNTAPEVTSIVRQTPATASTAATSVTFRVTFDEPVSNVDVTDFTLSGTASGTVNSVTPNSAIEYDVNITAVSGNGDNLNLDFAGGQDISDVAGNAFAGTINSEEEYTVDNSAPEVTSIIRQTPATASTTATSVTFRVTFDEGVINVDLADFVLSGTASGTLNSITPNSTTEYDINVISVSGNGDNLNLDFAGGQDITDIIGNTFGGIINSEQEYTIDNTAPEVTSIVRQSPTNANTNANSVTFRVTFNEGVTNVDLTDFVLAGTASGTLNGITPNSTSEYDIDVISVSGNGNLNLDFAGGQDIIDIIGNAFAGTINSEQEYTIDNVVPEVTSIVRQSPTNAITNANTVTFRVIFDEGVVNVDVTDFVLSGTASGTVNAVTPNSTTEYDVDVTTVAGDGTLNLDFGANNITDIAGNAFAGTVNSEEEYTIDNQAPIATITLLEDGDQISFEVTFNEQLATSTTSITDISNLLSSAINDPSGDNQSISVASNPGSVSWDLTTPTAPVVTVTIPVTTFVAGETLRVNFVNNAVQDPAGNGISSATNVDGTVTDVTPPSISPDEMSLNGTTSIQFTLSEEIDIPEGGVVSGFSTSNGTLTSAIYSGKGTTNLITLTGSGWSAGVTTVSYDPIIGDVLDLVGNELATITNHAVVVNTVNLSAGSIAFTYYRSDDPNEFAFVLLEDVEMGTQIKFTNNGWTEGPPAAFRAGEETLVWEADQRYFAGKEIKISGSTASSGSTSGSELTLSTSGDQIIAYQGTSVNPTLLSAIHMNGNWDTDNTSDNKSEEPVSQLTTGVNMIAITSETDNAAYDMSTLVGSASAIRSAINNLTNWDSDDNASNGISFTVPVDGDNYTLPPDVSSLTPANGSTVAGTQSTLTLTFDDNVVSGTSSGVDIQLKLDDGTPVATFNIGDPEVTVSGTDLTVDISSLLPLTHNAVYEVDVAEWIVVNTDGNHNIAIVGDTEWKFTVDGLAPTVTSITRDPGVTVNANFGTTASTVDYVVEFSEDVVPGTVQVADFTPAGAASGGTETVTNVTGSGTTYTVTVSNINLLGDLTINFTGAVDDLVGNTGSAFAAGDESFIIINPEPTEQATAFSAVPGADAFTLDASWTAGGGAQTADGYLIFIKGPTGTFPADPTDLIAIANELDFSDDEGVINSSTNSVSVSGLNSGTQYDFKVYPYTNSGNQIDYKIDGTILTGSGTTSTGQASQLSLLASTFTISSLTNTLGAASNNFRFTFTDDGLNNAIDNAPTRISQIIIKVGAGNDIAWTDAIEGVGLYDGSTTMNSNVNGGDIIITDTEITFNNVPNGAGELGEILDNASKNYSLRIWLKNPITDAALQNTIDGLNFVFEVDETSFSYASGSSEVAVGQVANSISTRNAVDVVATELNWEAQPPATAGVLAPFTSAPVVEATDANGNRDIHYVGAVTSVANAGGIGMNNNPDASGLAHSFTSGIYTFDITAGTGFNYQDAGDGTLSMTSTGLTSSPASNSVTVSYSDGTTIVAGVLAEEPNITNVFGSFAIIKEWVFTDDATATVDDNVPTRLTQVTITAAPGADAITTDWTEAFDQVVLSDPTTSKFTFGVVNSNSIVFAGIPNVDNTTPGYIDDNTSLTLRLYADMHEDFGPNLENIIDNRNFVVSITTADVDVESTGSSTIATGQSVVSDDTKNYVRIDVTQIVFEQQPPLEQLINTDFGVNAPVVEAADANGNRDLDYAESVLVTDITPLVFVNPPPAAFSNGALQFPTNFQYTQIGTTRLEITPTTPLLTPLPSIQSNSFTIRVGKGTTITAGGTSEPASINSTETSSPGTFVFDFVVNDDAGSEDDGNPTLIESLTITQGASFNDPDFSDWRNVIAGAQLSDGLNNSDPSDVTINAGNITFSNISTGSGLLGEVPDDATKTYTLTIWLQDSIDFKISGDLTSPPTLFADGKKLEFEIHEDNITTSITGSSFQDGETTTSGDANAIDVDATDLNFIRQPEDGVSFAAFNNPQPRIAAVDAHVNLDIDYNEAVLTFTNSLGLTMINTPDPGGLGQSFSSGILDLDPTFEFQSDGVNLTFTITTDAGSGYSAFSETSDQFTVNASEESTITFTNASVDIPYISHQLTTDKFILGEFTLTDGDGVSDDADAADTRLDELEISLTNPGYINEIALVDQSGFEVAVISSPGANETFSGFLITAPDGLGGSINFTIRASFNTTVIDNESIELSVTNASTSGGSKLNPAAPLPSVPVGNNNIEVLATQYAFTQSPNAIEGVNVPLTNTPVIEAQDANGLLDLDWNEVVSITSQEAYISLPPSTTINAFISGGSVALPSLRYYSDGYGTLTVSGTSGDIVTSASSGAPGSTDVIGTGLVQLTEGVEPAGDLPSGGINKVLLAFRLNARSNTLNEPVFNSITLHVSNDTTNIFENFRLFKVLTIPPPTKPIAGVDFVEIANAEVNASLSTAQDIVIDGFNEILDGSTDSDYYFIVANISTYANENTPATNISLGPVDIGHSSGSILGSAFTGNTYTFRDVRPPTYTLTPANEAKNVAPDAGELIITFDEPVIPLDTVFGIYLFADDSEVFVSNTITDISVDGDSTQFSIAIPTLADDTKYYVMFPNGSTVNNTGFVDRSGNVVDGIITPAGWSFTTADKNPPTYPVDPIATNIHNHGFDIEVQLDEEGEVYYMVVANNSTTPTAQEIFDNNPPVPGDLRASGSFTITQGFTNHYISISSLSQNTDYDVYLVAEDVVGNQMLDINRFKIDVKTTNMSGSGAIVFGADAVVCTGQYQEIHEPIHIIELNNDDFADVGSTQTLSVLLPSGYTFAVDSIPVIEYNIGADISSDPIPTFFSNSVLNIEYSLSGESNIDKFTIRNLFVQADEAAAPGMIVKSGDASIAGVGFGSSLGTVSAVTPTPVTFTTNPPNSLISINNVDFVRLIPSINDGTNIFEGTAVSGDLFSVRFAGVGEHTIQLTHTDDFGCISTFEKTIEIIDSDIEGLNSNYCSDAGEVTIPGSPDERPQFTLIDLKIETADEVSNPGDIGSLVADGNNWIFDPAVASFNETQEVALDFVGVYENIANTALKDTITQRVYVWLPPTVELATRTTGELDDLVNYCEDGSSILLEGSPKPATAISTGIFTVFDGSDFINHPSLIDQGDGTATIDPQLAANGLGYGELDIMYEYINDTTTCLVRDTITININPKPNVVFSSAAGCAGLPTQFTDLSSTPEGIGSVSIWQWNFDDISNNSSVDQNPEHIFINTGSYDVNLSATSDRRCVNDTTIQVSVGGIPATNFTYTGVNISDSFLFTSTTPKPGTLLDDEVDILTWEFGDGGSYISNDNNEQITYQYTNPLIDSISLTVETTLGCVSTLKKPVAILEKITDTNTPSAGFENGSEGWVILPASGNSWALSGNNADINMDGNTLWVTNPNSSYLPKERSYLYSPTYDISSLERPMIQFDAFIDLSTGDGVVLQYSTDNLNITDPAKTWTTFGAIDTGVDWYKGDNLASKPGESTDIGWTDSLGMVQPKHSLATIPDAEKTNLNFRFALASVNDPTNNPGFAFDNLFLGERTRTVLIENFTNTSQVNTTKAENDFIRKLIENDNEGVEVVNINYHTDFPGPDPINEINQADPSARAVFYNINETPRAVIDGFIYQDAPFSSWGNAKFELRSLSLSPFDIEIATSTANQRLEVETVFTPKTINGDINNLLLYIAVLEQEITLDELNMTPSDIPSGEDTLVYALRKILPNAAGVKIPISSLTLNVPSDPVSVSWVPTSIDLDDVAIVVFLQDEDTKEIYQAEILKNVDLSSLSTVTGTDPINVNSFNIFPNPANKQVTIQLKDRLGKDASLRIYDGFGKVVFEHQIDGGMSIDIDTKEYSAGLYHVQIEDNDNIIRKRLMIMHR